MQNLNPFEITSSNLNHNNINKYQESAYTITEFIYHNIDGCPLHATSIELNNAPESTHEGTVLILLHGGGPDHHSMVPLAQKLADCHTVILPDIRGYGRSVCTDPSLHTWTQYTNDIIALLDHIGASKAIIGGAGLGTTIALRTAITHPDRVHALVLISIEEIEDDNAKEEEIVFLDAFAARVQAEGIMAAWEPILEKFPPIIGNMVREAIPRSNPESIATAAAIVHDRSFRSVDELANIDVPTLIIPGIDDRHPTALAEHIAHILPNGHLAPVTISTDLQTADDFARIFAPIIRNFLINTVPRK
ncbi:alpha/beta hydrolase [Rhodocytophaga aerolata]|uniref:Alpha/beta hydrolase n=1 Tax=Rhodocytophaga aerolata TaxID=455078 RepID=A0ABT8RAT0_9BACT|nr:alpha/beta hydrolase [Rhodocytophaga aerolata]MDO1449210.1 alpha/beta hydrolase [Rhodocytophaga aerolata]